MTSSINLSLGYRKGFNIEKFLLELSIELQKVMDPSEYHGNDVSLQEAARFAIRFFSASYGGKSTEEWRNFLTEAKKFIEEIENEQRRIL